MKNFRLIKRDINVRPFLIELAQNEDFWSTARAQIAKVQRETINIYLRRGVEEEGKLLADSHQVRNTEVYGLFPFTTSWIENFVKDIGKLSRAMIVSLQAEGKVYPHRDNGEYYRIRDRYHLVLQSKGGTRMISGNEEQIVNAGELWYFNNKEIHEVFNQSASPRIHIIFDILPKNNFHLAT